MESIIPRDTARRRRSSLPPRGSIRTIPPTWWGTDRSRWRIIIISPPRTRRRTNQPLPLCRGRCPSPSTTTPKRRWFPPPLQRQRTAIPVPARWGQRRGRRPTCIRTTSSRPPMKIPLISVIPQWLLIPVIPTIPIIPRRRLRIPPEQIITREFFPPDSRRARPSSVCIPATNTNASSYIARIAVAWRSRRA